MHVDLRVVEQAEKVYLTGSTQINMLIPPYTQTWLFAQVGALNPLVSGLLARRNSIGASMADR